MRNLRTSIAGLMTIVLVAAVGLAALKNASETWAGTMVLLTCGILAFGIIGAIYRGGARRAWWIGFCIFGFGYLALSMYLPGHSSLKLPTTWLLEMLATWLRVSLHHESGGGSIMGGLRDMFDVGVYPYFIQAGHCLWSLLIALLGGMLAFLYFAASTDRSEESRPDSISTTPRPRDRWLRPMIMGLVILILATTVATVLSGSNAPLWAGITFSLACLFGGLTCLGAIHTRGPHRASWLGATLFGAGYAALVFSRPMDQPPRVYLPTDPFLMALRPSFPPIPKSISASNARILEALEQTIPMRFPAETSLGDVLKYIKQATATPTYPGIPIFVDPIGLDEVERSLGSTVQVYLEDIALKSTLRICLKQLGLAYDVKGGYLRITSEAEISSPDVQDPFLIVGHCLIALLAAGFGAVAAPIVAGVRVHSTASPGRT